MRSRAAPFAAGNAIAFHSGDGIAWPFSDALCSCFLLRDPSHMPVEMKSLDLPFLQSCSSPSASSTRFLWALLVVLVAGFEGALGQGASQDAKVAAGSIVIDAAPGAKKIDVSLRLVDDPSVTVVTAATGDSANPLTVPAAWRGFAGMPDAACAWLVVIDNSNPRRAQTVGACVEQVRRFLSLVPEGDAVMLATLARDLVVISPFGAEAEERGLALADVKASGEATLSTLIHQNLRMGIDQHLKERPEARKAIVILTDGKDETPGGPDAVRSQLDQLIERARSAKVAIHTLGFAEIATEATYFGNFKEVSNETDGLHLAAEVASRQLPANSWETIVGVMHGGGTASIDLAALSEPAPILLQLRTASGRRASLTVDTETVAKALSPVPVPEAAPAPAPTTDPTVDAGAPTAAEDDPSAPVSAAPENSDAGTGEPESEGGSNFLWWLLAGVIVLILIVVGVVVSQRKAEQERRRLADMRAAEQARILDERLSEEALASTRMPEAAPPPPLAYLEMCDMEQTRHPVTVPSLRIGRGQHNDLVLRNDSVSGNHCVLQRDRRGEWTITDLDSGNGVLVNGERVQKAILRHGDAVEFGDLKLRFLLNL